MTVPSLHRPRHTTPAGPSHRAVSHLLTAMINKYNDFFKHNLHFQKIISASYDREARRFQKTYNSQHPLCHIWRHILYARTFFFCRGGICFSVRVELLRFLYAGTSRTFTFYGSLFLAFSSFSKEFIRSASSPCPSIPDEVMLLIPACTLARWARLIRDRTRQNRINQPVAVPGPVCNNET